MADVRSLVRTLKGGMWVMPFHLWTVRRWEPGPIYMGIWQLHRNTIQHLSSGLTWGEFVKEFTAQNRYHPGQPWSAKDRKYDVAIWGGRW